MQSSNLGLQTWAIALYLLTTGIKGTSSMKMHREVGVTQKTAWHLPHRIRDTWRRNTNQPQMGGPVEADETFTGGKESNKHESERLHEGRGAVGKVAVAGVKDRATNRVRATVVPDTTGDALRGFVQDDAEPGAMAYTDGEPAYASLPRHEAVLHSVGEYVPRQAHTNGMESFWSMLKRGLPTWTIGASRNWVAAPAGGPTYASGLNFFKSAFAYFSSSRRRASHSDLRDSMTEPNSSQFDALISKPRP